MKTQTKRREARATGGRATPEFVVAFPVPPVAVKALIRVGVSLALLTMVSCRSSGLPDDFPLPEGAELTTSKDHAKLERPYYSYRVEMPREQLWTLVPKLLKDAGWTYYPDADPPRFGIAVREGKVVAVRMNGRLEGGSELSLQIGKPALLHAEGSCRQLQTCTDSVLRQVAPDSELASKMERHQMTVESGRMDGCRTMLTIASSDLEDAEIKVEDSSSCFEIPITYAVQKRAAVE